MQAVSEGRPTRRRTRRIGKVCEVSTLIEVTQDDIDEANRLVREGNDERRIADRCPVAIAATRFYGTPMRVHEPSRKHVWLTLHFKRRGFDNSGDVPLDIDTIQRIRRWDDDGWMQPFEFEVPR